LVKYYRPVYIMNKNIKNKTKKTETCTFKIEKGIFVLFKENYKSDSEDINYSEEISTKPPSEESEHLPNNAPK
jgi:hypothetical protein